MHARFAGLLWADRGWMLVTSEESSLLPARTAQRHGFSPASHPNSALTQFPKTKP